MMRSFPLPIRHSNLLPQTVQLQGVSPSFLTPETYWYPGTLLYVPLMGQLPFFVRATRHKDFRKLAAITRTDNVAQIREAVARGQKSLSSQGGPYGFRLSFAHMMNVDKLHTLV